MTDDNLSWDRAADLEADFMARLAGRVEECREFLIPGSGAVVKGRARRDPEPERDRGRETDRILEAEGIFDPVLRGLIPRGARGLWEVRGGSLFHGGPFLVVHGAVVHPVKELARGLTPGRRDAATASDLIPVSGEECPEVLAALSTSGWRGSAAEDPGLYLFEPASGGGYRRFGDALEPSPAYLALESEAELAARVVGYAERSRADLVLHGLSARSASVRLGVPVGTVRKVFSELAVEGEFLRVSFEEDDIVLRRA